MSRQFLPITGTEIVTGKRRFLGQPKPTAKQQAAARRQVIDQVNVMPQLRTVTDMAPVPTLAPDEKRPDVRRQIKRRGIPEEYLNPFTGALVISTRGPADRFSMEQVEQALIDCNGFISFAARLLKCTPELLRGMIKRYPRLQRLVLDVDEARLDIVEDRLFLLTQFGDLEACKFFLERKGKHRNWGKSEDAKGPRSVHIKIVPAPASPFRDGSSVIKQPSATEVTIDLETSVEDGSPGEPTKYATAPPDTPALSAEAGAGPSEEAQCGDPNPYAAGRHT